MSEESIAHVSGEPAARRHETESQVRPRVLTVIRHPVGGIRTFLNYTYGRLPPDTYFFTILATDEPESRQLLCDATAAGHDVVMVSPTRAAGGIARAVSAELSRRAYSLIHSQGFTAGALAASVNVRWRVPHVLTSHDVLLPEQFGGFRGWCKARALTALLNSVDVIHSVSQDAQANLTTYLPGVRRHRLRVISNGIDVDRFSKPNVDATSWRSTWDPHGEVLLLGFLGRLMPQKGFAEVVDAVELLVRDDSFNHKFVVVVVNQGGYLREHRADIEKRGLDNYFRFAPFVPDVSEVLANLDALLMPSRWEACPMQAMESLVAGCPLIATSCVGLREVVAETPAIVIPPASPVALAAAVRRLASDTPMWKARAHSFRPAARTRYDVTVAAAELDALFRQTLSRQLSPSQRSG